MAYINIKRLQIDQHRAWMLRTWFYLGTIVTLRIIQILAALITAGWAAATQYLAISCDEILSIHGGATNAVYKLYPGCNPNNTAFATDGMVVVKSNFNSQDAAEIAASLDMGFAMAGWLGLVVHAIGVEIYLSLTPKESSRLRQVSYERQLARGMKNPGSAGLVVEKFGDSDTWEMKPLQGGDLERH
jgi:hypothetical protein